MKKKSAILLSLAALALSIGAVGAIATGTDLLSAAPVAVKAADEQAKTTTLTFSSKTNSKGIQGYNSTWYATADDKTIFDIVNFNNNNNIWDFIRCGSKKAASVATIQNRVAFAGSVSQVKLTIDEEVTAANVNSIKLIVSSDKDGKTPLETVSIDDDEISKGEHLFNVASPAPGLFYKLKFDCKKSSNGVVQISKVVLSSEKGEVSPTISVPNGDKVELSIADKKSIDFLVANLPDGASIEASSDNKDICGVGVSEDGKKLEFSAGNIAGETTYKVVVKKDANELASFAGTIIVNPKGSKNQSVLFGTATGSISLDQATLTFKDGLQTNWSFLSSGTTSFTKNPAYSQVGSKDQPAKQINLSGSFAKPYTVQSVALKVGGFSGTAGDISLKLDGKEIGTGELNTSSDVIVKSSNAVAGFDLSVDISNIEEGLRVKIYSIEYVVLDNLTAEQEVSTFVADFIAPKAGKPANGDTCEVKFREAKSAYDRMSAEAKVLFDNDEAYASSKATYDYWAAHSDSANGTKALPSNLAKAKEANNNGALITTVAILGTASLGLIFACKKKHSK